MLIYALATHGGGVYDNWRGEGIVRPAITETDAAYPLFIGIVLYGGGAIFGIVRAATYHKPGSAVAVADMPWDLALVSDQRGNPGLKLSYTLRY